MQKTGVTIIILLTATLAAAIGWVLFHVGRIILAIIKQAEACRPLRILQHSDFGALMWEDSLWNGKAPYKGKMINFFLAGSESGPSAALLERLHWVLDRLPELEHSAIERIRHDEPKIIGGFTLTSLDFLWCDNPEAFAMEFLLFGNENGFWRVEFKRDKPISAGYED